MAALCRLCRRSGLPASGDARPWLIDALKGDQRPAIVATHVPVSGHSQVGNRYFENQPDYATYPDHAVIRRAVKATGKAAVWLSGHVHRDTICQVYGTWHLTLQAALEGLGRKQEPANAYGWLEIEGRSATWTVFGRDPFQARFPLSVPNIGAG